MGKLSLESIEDVCRILRNNYDLSFVTYEEINQGYSNRHFYLIDKAGNKYIARVSNLAKKDSDFIIEEYVLFNLSLMNKGCQIPVLIRNNTNELYTPIQANSHLRVHLFKYLEGETYYLWWEVPSKEHLLSIVSKYKLLNKKLMSIPCNNASFFTDRYFDTLELLNESHWISKQIVKQELEGNLNKFISCAFVILNRAEGILEEYDQQFVHGEMTKNHYFTLKSANSLRSNNADFFTVELMISWRSQMVNRLCLRHFPKAAKLPFPVMQ